MAREVEKTALLVMDVQHGIVDRLDNKDEYLAQLKATIDSAHQKHVLVIYVVVGFRAGFPEVSSHNKSFSSLKESLSANLVDPKPSVVPTKEDIVVVKRRVSAFSGSDLKVLLRARDIEHLVLTGIATSGVVLSTIREAADKDFQLTVLSDLCADFDAEVHSVLLEKVFPRQAEVMVSKQWINEA
jgi:nicotinamidase-related amidase